MGEFKLPISHNHEEETLPHMLRTAKGGTPRKLKALNQNTTHLKPLQGRKGLQGKRGK
ncbi:MAG: hypothetical protein ACI35P_02445 [Bacillus sp. (in: firmicutes)]